MNYYTIIYTMKNDNYIQERIRPTLETALEHAKVLDANENITVEHIRKEAHEPSTNAVESYEDIIDELLNQEEDAKPDYSNKEAYLEYIKAKYPNNLWEPHYKKKVYA
jgi:hypothetical protein